MRNNYKALVTPLLRYATRKAPYNASWKSNTLLPSFRHPLMAVFVDISNTTHLTYSPLNEKHNILYHRARRNVNERHVQRPWFDLNPFLDKEDDKGLKLDDYRPENDTGIQPLESLSIVEDYFSEKPLMTREFKIKEFWEFLFSNDWADGYSVRVLEGRLYTLMMSVLVNLTQSQSVVQHSTVAYAKNRRQKFSIYKLSNKEPELGLHEETLLLEFIYYGHLTKRVIETDDSSCGYPKVTTCSTKTSVTGGMSSEIELSEPDTHATTDFRSRSSTLEQTSSSSVGEMQPTQRHHPLKNRTQIKSDTVSYTRPPIDKSLSRVQEENVCALPKVSGIRRKHTVSTFSSGSEDYRQPFSHDVDLTKFACTERISYLGEFDLSDDSSSSSDDESYYTDYGQDLYLGDRSVQKYNNEMSAEEKLKRKKEFYKNSIQRLRERQEEVYEPKPLVPEFSKLDVQKYLNEDQRNSVREKQVMPDEVPDLEEFVDILKREERQEQVRKKKESKMKGADKKQKITKPGNERFADEVGGVTDSQACRLHCYQRDASWKMMSECARKNYLIEKMRQVSGKPKDKMKQRKVKQPPKEKKELEIPCIYVTTTSGISYIHPVSRTMVRKKLKDNKRKRESGSPTRRRLSLVHNMASFGKDIPRSRLMNISKFSSSSSPKSEEKVERKEDARKFPKAKVLVSGMESPDFDSDEESDGLEDSNFDSKKLNVRYSLERIKKKKLQKKRGSPTQKTIYKILKKYYRMQSILKAFSGPEHGKRKSVSSIRGTISPLLPQQSRQVRRRIKKLPTVEDEMQEKQVTVGKLKWFPFLDAKMILYPPCDDLDEPLFENYPMDKFRENLERALNEFVVRREVVISDYTAKASVSLTFTKKYVFSKVKTSI